MPAVITFRACLALLAVAAFTALPSAPAYGVGGGDEPAPSGSVLAETTGEPDPFVTTPARLHVLPAMPAVPLVPTAVAAVVGGGSLIGCRSPRGMGGLHIRLADVGDAWRALLLGAPPALL
jgi:hypothetical protein